jgi:hypothetical protein
MLKISDILEAFKPILEKIERNKASHQTTPLDNRITELFHKIEKISGDSWVTINGFHVKNTHLSEKLTLADLKTLKECGEKVNALVLQYLNLKQNIDKVESELSCSLLARIENVTENILKMVSLEELQKTGFVFDVKHSAVWFALVPDNQFLDVQIAGFETSSLATRIACTRYTLIEEKQPSLLQNIYSVPFSIPENEGKLRLTMRRIRQLSTDELHGIAKIIPQDACRLLSDMQVASIEFDRFPPDKLIEMIRGDNTDEGIERRLALLSSLQTKIYLKEGNGNFFGYFPDTFYQNLQLSKLSREQVNEFFSESLRGWPCKNPHAARHLQLVPAGEIVKGIHLLSLKYLSMLSDLQIQSLDYSKITRKQAKGLFKNKKGEDRVSLPKEEWKRRVALVPNEHVNNLIRTESSLVTYLASEQYKRLNVKLLHKKDIQHLFPVFNPNAIRHGWKHTIQKVCSTEYHWYHLYKNGEMITNRVYDPEDLEKKKQKCLTRVQQFSPQQLHRMKPKMHPEVQTFLSEFSMDRNTKNP